MKAPTLLTALGGALALAVLLPSAAQAEPQAWAREVIHFEKDRKTGRDVKTGSTESFTDVSKNTLTQVTRNARDVKVAHREFVMDSKGRIRRGLIKDGQGNPVSRMEYGFDAYDRIAEERQYKLPANAIFRRVLFRYTATGERVPDKVFYFNSQGGMIETKATEADATPNLPIAPGTRDLPGSGLPQFRGMPAPKPGEAAQSAPPGAPPGAPPEKRGVLDRIFNRKGK